MIIDLFAGPGGWDEGVRAAGYTGELLGIEKDEAACATARAAGHERLRGDVAAVLPDGGDIEAPDVDGLIASPPCQAWSRSGKRGGIKDQPRIFAHLAEIVRRGEYVSYPTDGWHDDRSPLVLEVLRWADDLRPRWIACEQVPDVLPFWEQTARWLRGLGYSAWTGVLHAEEYGVPQTRERAILVARRDGIAAGPPQRTHARYYPPKRWAAEALDTAPDLFDTERLPWVSMAEALGWTADVELTHQRGRGMVERHGERPGRPMDAPAPTITGAPEGAGFGSRLHWRLRNSPMDNASERDADEPAGTIYCSRPGNLNWVVRTGNNSMSSSRTGSKAGDGGVVPYERPVTDPAPTLDTNVGGKWRLHNNNRPNSCVRDEDQPAGTLYFGERTNDVHWVHDRPATTVQGDPRIGRPGHKDREGGESQFDQDSVRVTVAEAAVLQGFRPDYPWQGNKSAQYRQVGDAVPPPLAAAVVAPLLVSVDRQAVAS